MWRMTSFSRGLSWSSSGSSAVTPADAGSLKASSTNPASRGENTASPPWTRLDRVDQLGRRDRLGDVATRPGADDRDDVLGRVGHRQRQERLVGVGRATPSITARPPPPGMCTSSRTTSGLSRRMSPIAGVDVAGVADDVRRAGPSSARTPARNRRWSSTRYDRDVVPCSLASSSDAASSRSAAAAPRAPTRCRRPARYRAWPCRRAGPAGRRIESAIPRRSAGDRRRVEALAAVAHERRELVVLDLDVQRRRGRRRRACRRWPAPRGSPRPVRATSSSTGAVADDHQLDVEVVGRLDLGEHVVRAAPRTVHLGLGDVAPLVEPGPQLAFLRPGQRDHRGAAGRRSAGSARASAAPSRAGARPPRRVPRCGSARAAPRSAR